jgi:hypothetical protein
VQKVNFIYSVSLGALLLSSVNGAAAAQPSAAQPNQPVYPAQQWVRDPFTPSALMYKTVGAQSGMAGGAYGFVPSADSVKIPQMKLKGLMNQDEENFIALLEVAGVGTFMVREGDEFNIDPSQPQNAIRVDKITRLSVTVETGMLGSIRVLR